jgi:hypothetical protein
VTGDFELALELLMQGDASRQIEGAKRLSTLLKPQTLLEDAPVEPEQLDATQEERRALLRTAWSAAIDEEMAELPKLARAEGAPAGTDAVQGEGRQPVSPLEDIQELDDDAILQSTLGFGDVSFDMVAEALGAIDALGLLPRRGGMVSGGVVVDFTARGGQFALAAALLHPFDYVLGVEGSEEQCELARARLSSLQNSLAQIVSDDDQLTWEVSFEHSGDDASKDVEESGLLAADFVAINCAGLNDYQINELGEAMLGLRPNAVIISYGRRVPCPGAQLLDTRILTCQWDDFPCYILQRVSDGHNDHLPPVDLPVCAGFPANRESGSLLRAGNEAAERLVHLMGGAAAVASALGQKEPKEGGSPPSTRLVDPPPEVQQIAAMALSYCAHSERIARRLVDADFLVVDRIVHLLNTSRASENGEPTLGAAAAVVMLLRALGKHPCALPAIVDTPGCVDALVGLLSFDHLAVAAGAADALSSCLVFVESRALIMQAGALQGLKVLKSRAAAGRHQQALETAELVLSLLDDGAAAAALSTPSPLYEHLKGLGLDKGR